MALNDEVLDDLMVTKHETTKAVLPISTCYSRGTRLRHAFQLYGGMRLTAITELPPEFIAHLEEQGIKTDADLLSLTSADISHKLPPRTITLGQINNFKATVARGSSAPGVSARILLDSASVASSKDNLRCPSLGPTLPILAPCSGRVIEVSGLPNSGKSVGRT